MKRLDISRLFSQLSDEDYVKVKALKDEMVNKKMGSRAQRRKLDRSWQKYAKREEHQ